MVLYFCWFWRCAMHNKIRHTPTRTKTQIRNKITCNIRWKYQRGSVHFAHGPRIKAIPQALSTVRTRDACCLSIGFLLSCENKNWKCPPMWAAKSQLFAAFKLWFLRLILPEKRIDWVNYADTQITLCVWQLRNKTVILARQGGDRMLK